MVSHRPKENAGGQSGLSGKGGVACQRVADVLAAEYEIFHALTGNGHRYLRNGVGANFVRYLIGAVYEHAVSAGGYEERYRLVRLVGASAAVGVPDFYVRAVFNERSELLAEAVEVLAYRGVKLLSDICSAGVGRVAPECVVGLYREPSLLSESALENNAGRSPSAAGEPFYLCNRTGSSKFP